MGSLLLVSTKLLTLDEASIIWLVVKVTVGSLVKVDDTLPVVDGPLGNSVLELGLLFIVDDVLVVDELVGSKWFQVAADTVFKPHRSIKLKVSNTITSGFFRVLL